MRKIMKVLLLLGVIIILGCFMFACQNQTNSIEQIDTDIPINNYTFQSCLKIGDKIMPSNSKIELNDIVFKGTLQISNTAPSFLLRVVLFSEGVPIRFMVDDQEYSSYLFEASGNIELDFSLKREQLPKGESKFNIVFLTIDNYSMVHNRDDEKYYSFTMKYQFSNNSFNNDVSDTIQKFDTDYLSYDRYIKKYWNSEKYDGYSKEEYDYAVETLKSLTTQDELDICFMDEFVDNNNFRLSVKRNIAKSQESPDSKVGVRICGNPGDYYLTFFCNGEAYNAFGDSKTVRVSVKENGFTLLNIDLPEVGNMADAYVYGLAVPCATEEDRVYDSGVLHVYFSVNDVSFTMINIQKNCSVQCQGELVDSYDDNQIFDYTGDSIKYRVFFKEQSSSAYHRYQMMVFADGIPQRFYIEEENNANCYTSFLINEAYNGIDLTINVYLQLIDNKELFDVEIVFVPVTVSSSLTPAEANTLQKCTKKVIHHRIVGDAPMFIVDDSDYYIANWDEYGNQNANTDKLSIDLYNDANQLIVGRFVEQIGMHDFEFTLKLSSGNGSVTGVTFIVVNGQVFPFEENKYLARWGGPEVITIPINVSSSLLNYGMNDIYVFSNVNEEQYINRLCVYVYGESNQFINFHVNTQNEIIDIETNISKAGVLRGYCCSVMGENSLFFTLVNSPTIRNIFTSKSIDDICIGEANADARIPLVIILQYESCENGLYTFSRTKTIQLVL